MTTSGIAAPSLQCRLLFRFFFRTQQELEDSRRETEECREREERRDRETQELAEEEALEREGRVEAEVELQHLRVAHRYFPALRRCCCTPPPLVPVRVLLRTPRHRGRGAQVRASKGGAAWATCEGESKPGAFLREHALAPCSVYFP